MKAIIYEKFGPPEVLQIKEVDKPIPGDNEVLIKIHSATVAAEDPGMRASVSINGIRKPKRQILGFYLAGEIETTGKDVSKFKTGDRVYGFTGMSLGAYAEFKVMAEDKTLAKIPAGLSYEDAVAIPNGALTVLPYLRDKCNIQKGHKVLINGASGAVGTAAVQIAKFYGAEVTAVCSTANMDMVQSLGADVIIDYTKEDFTANAQAFDIIFDTVAKSSFSKCKNSLKPGGIFMTTMPSISVLFNIFRNKKSRFAATGLMKADKKSKDLAFINELIEAGKLKPVIDRIYPIEEIVEAHRYVEKGHKKGNVVINVNHGLNN